MRSALRECEQERLRVGRALLKRSADLGCYLSGPPRNETEATRFKEFRQPDVLLHGIAAINPYEFLED